MLPKGNPGSLDVRGRRDPHFLAVALHDIGREAAFPAAGETVWADASGDGAYGEGDKTVEGSTLELYRSALRLRRERLIADERFEWIDLGTDVLAFRRGSGVVCAVNYGEHPVALPPGELLLASLPVTDELLPPDAAAWVVPTLDE